MSLTAKATKSDHESIWEEIVCDYVDSLQFGTVEVVVRDQRVVEIEKTERLRLTKTAESPSRSRCSGCGCCPSRSIRSWRPPARLAGRLSAAPGQTPAVRLPSPLPRRLLSGQCVGLNRSSPSSPVVAAGMCSAPAAHHWIDSFRDLRWAPRHCSTSSHGAGGHAPRRRCSRGTSEHATVRAERS